MMFLLKILWPGMKLYEIIYFNKYKQTTIRLSENSLFKNIILGRKDFTERILSLLPDKHLRAVNDFIGAPNIFSCDYCNRLSFGLVEVKCGDISLVVSSEGEKIKKVAILPEDIYISNTIPPGSDVNRAKGRLIEIEESSSTINCTVITGKNSLKVKLPQEIFASMSLNTGDEVWLILALRKLKTITDGD